jgi:NDP-sugar pyrophosphorylase family protein
MLPLAILAGGLATRMRPMTETVPKALLPVAGRPFVGWQLDLLRRKGIKRVVMCIGYRGEQIRQYVSAKDFGLEVFFSCDGNELIGTGGAIKKAIPLLGDAFFVLYGDSYLDINYTDIEQRFRNSGKDALMTVCRNENRCHASNAVFQNEQILCYDKTKRSPDMRHIDYGLGVFKACAFDNYDGGFDLAYVYKNLIEANKLAGYEEKIRFFEIGSPDGLRELEERLYENAKT